MRGYLFDFVFSNEVKIAFPHLSKVGNKIMMVTRHLTGKWHEGYTDNYYMIPKNAIALWNNKILITGTWRANYGVPQNLRLRKTSSKAILDEWKDGYIAAYCIVPTRFGDCVLIGVAFYGTKGKPVYMMTTSRYLLEYQTGGSHAPHSRLVMVHKYNTEMGGDDMFDRLAEAFSSYIKSLKWWRRLFSWFLDSGVSNPYALCLFLDHPKYNETTHCAHEKMIRDLIDELILDALEVDIGDEDNAIHVAKKARTHISRNSLPVSRFFGPHFPDERSRNQCIVCRLSDKYAKNKSKVPRPYTGCEVCKVNLCLPECYKIFHTKATWWNTTEK